MAVGKMIGAAEFKAKCLAILDEVKATGEPVTVTKRGKPIAVLSASSTEAGKARRSAIGFLQSDAYRDDWDPSTPASHPGDWDALR